MAIDGENSVTMMLVSYNQESYVGEAVRSALAQTYRPLRILISDDCSTDGTFGVIERLVAEYRGPHDVRVNRNATNLGLIGHLHRCIELIDSEWVVAAAGDDISEPNRVQRIMDFISAFPGVDAVHSAVRTMRSSGSVDPVSLSGRLDRFRPPFCQPTACIRERLLGLVMFWRGAMFGGSAAYRRNLWTAYPVIGAGCAEDTVIGFRAALAGGVGYLREPMVRYRHHSSNIWSVASESIGACRRELDARRLRMVLAAIDQHVVDISAAQSLGVIGPDLAAELCEALGCKRAIAEASLGSGRAASVVVAGLLADAAVTAFPWTAASPRIPVRIQGWVRLGLRSFVERRILGALLRETRASR